MAELKTKPTDESVEDFLNSVENDRRREDSLKVLELMKEVTGEAPKMWGSSIVGFGSYCYQYASGRVGEWMAVGFSPRKQSLTLYIMDGFGEYDALLGDLGKHRTGKSCLYINKLDDVNMEVLRDLVQKSFAHVAKQDE
jgi:hypothetical protein